MNSIVVIGIIISIILGASSFIASNNYIVGGACLLVSLLYFLLIARPLIKRHAIKLDRFNECYHFINNFIVSLSVKGTINAAYESAVLSMPEDFSSRIENVETFSNQDKLEHLNKYFKFHIFALFIDLMNLFEEQGGNILEMSHYLLEESRQIEEYISTSESIARKRLIEFCILWFLTIAIMVFMRFALSQFFGTISKQLFYPIGIGALVLFCLVSIHMAITKMCSLKIKGWNNNEKI